MSLIIRCTLLLTFAALLCIRDPAAASSPAPSCSSPACPSPSCPSPACPPPSSPACPSLFHGPNPLQLSTSHTFKQSSLWLRLNLSSSSPFTINSTNDVLSDCSPSLAFIITELLLQPIELTFDFAIKDSVEEQAPSLLAVCESGVPQSQEPVNSSCKNCPDHFDSEGAHFNYSVSLSYKADLAEVLVQAIVNYESGTEINQTFMLNTTGLQPDAHYAKESDDSIVLDVGYATSAEPTIDIIVSMPTRTIDAHSPISIASSLTNQNNSKSHHIKVVVWVIVGVSMVTFLVGLLILALSIKKHRKRHPSFNSSRSPGHGVLPSTTTRAPFPHKHLESGGTPMMSALPLSPPYNTNDFQISGTASWLKQPNVR